MIVFNEPCLQYEKHLQDNGLKGSNSKQSHSGSGSGSGLGLGSAVHGKHSHRSGSRHGSAVSFNEVNVAHVLHVNEFGELPDDQNGRRQLSLI